MKLLLVDDDAKLAAALRRGLTAEGFSVEVAADGPDGLWRGPRGRLRPDPARHHAARAATATGSAPTCAGPAITDADPDAHRQGRRPRRGRGARHRRRRLPAQAVLLPRAGRPGCTRCCAGPRWAIRRRWPSATCGWTCARAACAGAATRGAAHRPRVRPARLPVRRAGPGRLQAARSSPASGTTTSRATRTWSRSTSPGCGASWTSRPGARRIETVRGAGYRLAATGDRRRPRPARLRFRVTALAALAVLAVPRPSPASGWCSPTAPLLTDEPRREPRRPGRRRRRRAARRAAGRRSADLPADDVVVQVVDADGTVRRRVPGLPPPAAWTDAPSRTTVTDGTTADDGSRRGVLATAGRRRHACYVAGTPGGRRGEHRAPCVAVAAVGVPLSAAVLAGARLVAVGRALRPVEAIRAEVDRDLGEPAGPAGARAADGRRDRPAGAHDERDARPAGTRRPSGSGGSSPTPPTSCAARWPGSAPSWRSTRAHPAIRRPGRAPPPACWPRRSTLQRLVDDLLLLARGRRRGAGRAGAGAGRPRRRGRAQVAARRPPASRAIDAAGVRPVQVPGDREQLQRAVAQPARQRRPACPGPDRRDARRRAPDGARSSPSPTTGPGSRRPTGSGSSSGSPGSTTPAPPGTAVPGWAWPSPGTSPSGTAAAASTAAPRARFGPAARFVLRAAVLIT